jgi:hypothetical protein
LPPRRSRESRNSCTELDDESEGGEEIELSE